MKPTRYFLGIAGVAFGMLAFLTDLLPAQERITVQAVATLTWDEIVRIDAERSLRPEAPRVIPPPHPGPAPREIGSLKSSESVRPVTPPEPRQQGAKPDATAFSLPPALSFLALPDNNTSIPPDTHGAVGPLHAMTMLNTEVRIQTKLGATTSTVSLASFWSAITGSKFDPKVLYDAGSSRWIAVCDADGNLSTSKICFAMTTTSDPTGTWNFYSFDADAADATWADYPGFGVNATWVAITHNMFTVAGAPAFVGEKMWVIDKASALDGPPITTTVFPTDFDFEAGFGTSGFTMQPCQTFGAEPTLYIVDNPGFTVGPTFLIRISRITGTGPAPVWSVIPGSAFAGTGLFPVTNNFNFSQIDADQLGLATDIETNDPRMLNAVFRNTRIWCTHSAGLPVAPAASNRTAVFWYQLNPTIAAPIVQSGVLDGGVGKHNFFPAITANSLDGVVVGFTRSDATMFTQAVYAGRLTTDLPGTMQPIQTLKTGETDYTKFFGGPLNRWGDYSASVVDPVDDVTFWTIQEYAGTKVGAGVNDGRWGTWWGKIVPPGELPIQLSYLRAVTTQQNSVRVEWGTITETNNFGFYVQKKNGELEWSEIPNSFVPGHGTTLEPQHYRYVDQSATAGRWYYRLKQVDLDGTAYYTEGVEVDVVTTVSQFSVPAEYALHQNYPNPFNPSTTISFDLPASSNVKIEVFDLLGRKTGDLLNELKNAGTHVVQFDASSLPSGVYLYKLTAKGFSSINKMMLLR